MVSSIPVSYTHLDVYKRQVVANEEKQSFKTVAKKLFSSIPFCTYIILFFLSLFHIAIPTQILTVTSIAGNANAFLAMLMIGILLEIKLDLSQIRLIKKILLNRYAVTSVSYTHLKQCPYQLPLILP